MKRNFCHITGGVVDFTLLCPYNRTVKKLTQEEIDEFVRGKGLIEIKAADPEEGERILGFLKKHGAFIATPKGTFKVTGENLDLLRSSGFNFSEVSSPKSLSPGGRGEGEGGFT